MAEARQAGLWDAAKREAQSAFNNIGDAYQQVLLTGHIYPSDRSNLNREIAETSYQTPQQEELFYLNHFHSHGSSEPQLEPEM